ncbi:type II 3-dehydroquinate dehydratase, partial [Alphaproteobacteria bacterium]|nr:type II 3-dehydroquinate dehydratase [Alphaproteobacteria bacterium]
IQKANGEYEGIIINAGGYSHTSVAIRDSLALFSGIIIEVHISNIYGREEFRHTSMISSISNGVIVGLGAQSYNLAMRALAESFLTE